jgi:GNAT superfamily N-acetyltransferase
MRRATEADRPAVEAFLVARAVTSMFPLTNLARHGMDGDHDRAMRFWLCGGPDGLTDAVGITREGMVLPSCDGTPWAKAARALSGRDILGVMGASAQARPLIAALGLDGAATELDEDEPQFLLDLGTLVVPDGPGVLRPLSQVDRSLMVAWRRDASIEALGVPPAEAGARAAADIDRFLGEETHRVLVGPQGPLALTGFNAEAAGLVQVGAVYTPPALRSRGHARRAVALHLAEARARGMRQATLFTASAAAVRAYRAIGFHEVGAWTLFILRKKVRALPQEAPANG